MSDRNSGDAITFFFYDTIWYENPKLICCRVGQNYQLEISFFDNHLKNAR